MWWRCCRLLPPPQSGWSRWPHSSPLYQHTFSRCCIAEAEAELFFSGKNRINEARGVRLKTKIHHSENHKKNSNASIFLYRYRYPEDFPLFFYFFLYDAGLWNVDPDPDPDPHGSTFIFTPGSGSAFNMSTKTEKNARKLLISASLLSF